MAGFRLTTFRVLLLENSFWFAKVFEQNGLTRAENSARASCELKKEKPSLNSTRARFDRKHRVQTPHFSNFDSDNRLKDANACPFLGLLGFFYDPPKILVQGAKQFKQRHWHRLNFPSSFPFRWHKMLFLFSWYYFIAHYAFTYVKHAEQSERYWIDWIQLVFDNILVYYGVIISVPWKLFPQSLVSTQQWPCCGKKFRRIRQTPTILFVIENSHVFGVNESFSTKWVTVNTV